jgi:aminoglycoside phosphotransferase (APT) family kinase protein
MIPGAPSEAQWVRTSPRRDLPADVLERIVSTAFPRNRILDAELLGDGLRNSNFKLNLDSMREAIVLRIYKHDASLCRKELDVLGFVRDSVPVPEVFHAEPLGMDGVPPFALLRYVEGITLPLCGNSRSSRSGSIVRREGSAAGRFAARAGSDLCGPHNIGGREQALPLFDALLRQSTWPESGLGAGRSA